MLHCFVLEIRKTEIFAKWLDALRDVRARARVQVRIERLAAGNPGDVQPIGEGVSEMRIDYGPGYRVYFKRGAVPFSRSSRDYCEINPNR